MSLLLDLGGVPHAWCVHAHHEYRSNRRSVCRFSTTYFNGLKNVVEMVDFYCILDYVSDEQNIASMLNDCFGVSFDSFLARELRCPE